MITVYVSRNRSLLDYKEGRVEKRGRLVHLQILLWNDYGDLTITAGNQERASSWRNSDWLFSFLISLIAGCLDLQCAEDSYLEVSLLRASGAFNAAAL